MLSHIDRLHSIAHKHTRHIIGLMSGTSLDGLDIAHCRITGSGNDTVCELLSFETVPYPPALNKQIRNIFANKDGRLEEITLLHQKIGAWTGDKIIRFIAKYNISNNDVDLIASHGQTIFHAPSRLYDFIEPNATLQIGDADQIAHLTGIMTVSDFRQKHIAMGGEGAPLAIYGDQLLFRHPSKTRFLINIGGIANFSFLPPIGSIEGCFATDTGPGNTLIDAAMTIYFDKPFDKEGNIASQGRLNMPLLNLLRQHPFLGQDLPKSTGQETFSWEWISNIIDGLSSQPDPFDLVHTLTYFTAASLANAIKQCLSTESEIYISGGGTHNTTLMNMIQAQLPQLEIYSTDRLNINPDAKEAVLFALLANEMVAGNLRFGKISLP